MNPAHIDLFRAVMRHGGMTRAAEALGIGQPHISRAVAQLEDDLGFLLFVRGHGSALPTLEGEAFSHEVERTYAGLDHLRQAARQIRELGTGPLRIACQPSLAARLVPRAIRRLVAEYPGSRISLNVLTHDAIWSVCGSGQCDIGLCRPRSGFKGVVCEPFFVVDALCALPRGHVLVRKRVITAEDLQGEPLIADSPGVLQQAVDEMFERAGIVPRFDYTAQYTAPRCGLVAEGLGIAIVDAVPARALTGLPIALRPFRPRISVETVLIRPEGRPPSNLAAGLIALLKAERDAMPVLG